MKSAIAPCDGDPQWQVLLAELIARPRPALGTVTPSGAVLLGKGRTADVWGFRDFAIKLFRHREGIAVPKIMPGEIETYERLSSCGESGLPRLFAHGAIDAKPEDGNACGWAKYSRLPGQPLTFDELEALAPVERARWVCDLVTETINIESSLSAVEPLPSWRANYSDVRTARLKTWGRESGAISVEDLALTAKLSALIQGERNTRIYIHGDFNPPNIVADFERMVTTGSIVKFVDPMISYDAPESNWRHFTWLPELAEALAREYGKRAGAPSNHRLMYAIGAFTHLYNAIAEPQQAAFRRRALARCLDKIAMTPS